MAGSGTNAWPALAAPSTGQAESVEQKFDWAEANLLPMLNGSATDAVFDLGNSTSRWRDLYLSGNPRFTSLTMYASATAAVTIANNGIVSFPIQSKIHVFRSTDLSFTSIDVGNVPFNGVFYDDRNEYTTTTGFTAAVTGRYLIYCQLTLTLWETTTGVHGGSTLRIFVNDALYTSKSSDWGNAVPAQNVGSTGTIHITDILRLTAGQTVEIDFIQNSVESNEILAGTGTSFLTISKLS